MSPPAVILRCEAGPLVGAGHLVRSLALAEGFRRAGAAPRLLTPSLPDAWRAMVTSRGIELVEAELEPGSPGLDAAGLGGGSRPIVVIDSYELDAEGVRAVRQSGAYLAVIRDGDPAFGADAVIDHNLSSSEAPYEDVPLRLLGPRHALLREEFRDVERAASGEIPSVLVSLGGSTTEGLLPRLIDGLALVEGPMRVRLIVSPWDRPPALRERTGLSLERVPPQPTLAGELAAADLAVLAAGGVRFEAAAAGCPMLLGILAENQREDAESFASAGAARLIGWWSEMTPEELGSAIRDLLEDPKPREELAARARSLVDGRGAERAARAILEAHGAGEKP